LRVGGFGITQTPVGGFANCANTLRLTRGLSPLKTHKSRIVDINIILDLFRSSKSAAVPNGTVIIENVHYILRRLSRLQLRYRSSGLHKVVASYLLGSSAMPIPFPLRNIFSLDDSIPQERRSQQRYPIPSTFAASGRPRRHFDGDLHTRMRFGARRWI
jgi:hypothetical protein